MSQFASIIENIIERNNGNAWNLKAADDEKIVKPAFKNHVKLANRMPRFTGVFCLHPPK